MNEVSHFKNTAKLNTTNTQTQKATKFDADAYFVYIIHGTKQLFFEKNHISYSEGELIYVSEQTTLVFQNTPNEKKEYLEIEIRLPKPLLLSLLNEEQAKWRETETDPTLGYNEKVISETASERLNALFHSLKTALETSPINKNEICEIKRVEILRLAFASEHRFIANKLRYDIASSTQKIIQQTWNSIFSDRSLSEIAEMCALPLFSFKQQFKKTTGTTPYNWILQHRLMHAHFLLCATKESIKAIASKCCFNAESHFTKLFKREFGTTPSEYRKKILFAIKNSATTENNRNAPAK